MASFVALVSFKVDGIDDDDAGLEESTHYLEFVDCAIAAPVDTFVTSRAMVFAALSYFSDLGIRGSVAFHFNSDNFPEVGFISLVSLRRHAEKLVVLCNDVIVGEDMIALSEVCQRGANPTTASPSIVQQLAALCAGERQPRCRPSIGNCAR